MNIVGHRGAKGLAPENTLASLKTALRHHVDEIEFDVRVTRDGVPVLHHDAAVQNNASRLLIGEHTFAELRRLAPELATLQAALDTIAAEAVAHIEIKAGEPVKPILEVVKLALGSKQYRPEQLRFASKHQPTLRRLHQALPDVPVVVIDAWSGVRARWRARQLGTTIVSMNQRWLWPGFIRAVRRSGWQLYAYPVNDPAQAKRWAEAGLAGVITDFPDRFEKR